MTTAPGFAAHRDAARRRLTAARLDRPGTDSISWTIGREVIVVLAWGRAILLQFAHPLIAAGVAEHSSFRRGSLAPVDRLFSTIRAMLALSFGNEEEAIAAAAGINVIHDRVAGRLGESAGQYKSGTAYSAHDPQLLRWVHTTLLDSVPAVYELLVRPLTAEERDRYCAEAAVVEPLLGIPAGLLPRTSAGVDRVMTDAIASGAIVVSATARELARAVLWPPRSALLWPVLRPLRLLTIGLLPEPVREAYGFPWTARDARAFRRWVWTIRLLRAVTPPMLREWPASRRASRSLTRGQRRIRPASSSA